MDSHGIELTLLDQPNRIARLVVVGASAGGVEAVSALVSQLPEDLDAAVFVVLHIPPNATSYLPQILSRAGPLEAIHPIASGPIKRGVIYVAPPDRHLLVRGERVTTEEGPPESGHRPAVDPLFRSAAESWGDRVIGIVLTGNLDDGTAGLAAIKARGGVALVQSPDETKYAGMPTSAIEHVDVDQVLRVKEMGSVILQLIDKSSDSSGR